MAIKATIVATHLLSGRCPYKRMTIHPKYRRRTISPTIIIHPSSVGSRKERKQPVQAVSNVDVDEWFRAEYNKLLTPKEATNKVSNSVLQRALEAGDIDSAIRIYDAALAAIPYDTSRNNQSYHNEHWYRVMFMMLIRGAGILSFAEVRTSSGRSDLLIQFTRVIIVLEFKVAQKTSDVEKKIADGTRQMLEKEYAKGYRHNGQNVICAVIVADNEKKHITAKVIE